ncbi:MAG TPA: glycosyltransferase family 1 protein [Planctomycetota bacterium]|nr:glycosyltransferase family 1 protein [Planctomycetota bacterium]
MGSAVSTRETRIFAPLLDGRDGDAARYDVICLTHLRWDFVFQRPQHLLSRCGKGRRVFVVEEPHFDAAEPRLDQREDGQVLIAVPHLPGGLSEAQVHAHLRALLDGLIAEHAVRDYVLWYYTPMALPFSDHLQPRATVFDSMDELSLFKGAPPELVAREAELIRRADVVFTGGQSLYEAKKHRHDNIHAFPSSIEFEHFRAALSPQDDPADQAGIAHPRIGFYGVVDERFDIELLREVALLRPDWQFVILGPVVKIDPAHLPKSANIHYLGMKKYAELPRYLSGWDVAMLPFARNEATRFISPTKTPEYLAAGRPVVSTPITDVVEPYGNLGLVAIADEPRAFAAAIEHAMEQGRDQAWRGKVDAFLAGNSWDRTWMRMRELIDAAVAARS